MGTTLYSAFTCRRVSAADTLKAYQAYILACPFRKMSNIFADKSIGRLTKGATKIHIIDFGILYGFQWPCLIQGISLRPGGPPKTSHYRNRPPTTRFSSGRLAVGLNIIARNSMFHLNIMP
ncbi:hypothetical protein ACH5RR_010090 [Cinchona calisaya]|uniref:Uncharacterized protein n=1 Tax=Cinchona calisaya TaxID=153742 RepID=A0ABD3AHI0_9GENT